MPASHRGFGSTLALFGLALVGIGPSDLGMAITLLGLVTLIVGVHRFGRLGPEGGYPTDAANG